MLLPNVLAVKNSDENVNQVRLELHLPIDLDYFEGHFPNLPVLPGVVQIDWAVRYAREYLAVKGRFVALEHIKFQSLVLPDATLELLLHWNEKKNQIEFSFLTSNRKYSSGCIVFGDV
jgi:3-hydroxyacyl-[acyl-carrier-protein] dehydratase